MSLNYLNLKINWKNYKNDTQFVLSILTVISWSTSLFVRTKRIWSLWSFRQDSGWVHFESSFITFYGSFWIFDYFQQFWISILVHYCSATGFVLFLEWFWWCRNVYWSNADLGSLQGILWFTFVKCSIWWIMFYRLSFSNVDQRHLSPRFDDLDHFSGGVVGN